MKMVMEGTGEWEEGWYQTIKNFVESKPRKKRDYSKKGFGRKPMY